MRRTKCFGINLARLDIRQESSRHSQLISEYVKKKYKKNYLKMSEKEKIQFLKSQIFSKQNQINKFKFKNKENKEVWSTFKILANEPHECLGAYVISMTTSASDILSVSCVRSHKRLRNRSDARPWALRGRCRSGGSAPAPCSRHRGHLWPGSAGRCCR